MVVNQTKLQTAVILEFFDSFFYCADFLQCAVMGLFVVMMLDTVMLIIWKCFMVHWLKCVVTDMCRQILPVGATLMFTLDEMCMLSLRMFFNSLSLHGNKLLSQVRLLVLLEKILALRSKIGKSQASWITIAKIALSTRHREGLNCMFQFQLTARSVDLCMPLSSLPRGDEWICKAVYRQNNDLVFCAFSTNVQQVWKYCLQIWLYTL